MCPTPTCPLYLLTPFPHLQVRDAATDVPLDYAPPEAFNLALQHTEPKISWDNDDVTRKKKLGKRYQGQAGVWGLGSGVLDVVSGTMMTSRIGKNWRRGTRVRLGSGV